MSRGKLLAVLDGFDEVPAVWQSKALDEFESWTVAGMAGTASRSGVNRAIAEMPPPTTSCPGWDSPFQRWRLRPVDSGMDQAGII